MLPNSVHSPPPEEALPKSRWQHIKSYFPTKRILKKIGANVLEFSGTALQIASEITTFVAGMGFFIAPPLKKMYAELMGKNMHYTVNGKGALCIDNLDQARLPINSSALIALNTTLFNDSTPNSLCSELNKDFLLSSNVLFNLPFPETLFAASVILFSLGCSGLVVAYGLKKAGASLHDSNEVTLPSAEQVVQAKKMNNPLLFTSNVLLVGSRTAAIYATTTISMTMTLRNVPSILENFSIPSSKEFIYSLDNSIFSSLPEQENTALFKTIRLTMHFITNIDFSELKKAAKKGSKNIDSYDYYIGLSMAVVALALGYAALKTKQQSDRYADVLLRHKHAQELCPVSQQQLQVVQRESSDRAGIQANLSAHNPNRLFGVIDASQDNNPDKNLSLSPQDILRLDV